MNKPNIKDNLVKVSSAEPNTGEEVWFKKGNQLFDKNNYAEAIGTPGSPDNHTFTGGGTNHCLVLQCRPNTTYTVQKRNNGDTNRFALASAVNYPNSTDGTTTAITNFIRNDNANKISITSGASDKYLIIHYYRENETVLTKQQLLDSIMVNQGSNALTYEAYIEKEIYVKNENGVYEKFINADNIEKSIAAVTFVNHTNFNINPTYIDANFGYTRFDMSNKLCIANFNFKIIANASSGTVLLSNLPKPKARVIVPLAVGTNLARCYIDTTGELKADGSINTTGWVNGNVSYLI